MGEKRLSGFMIVEALVGLAMLGVLVYAVSNLFVGLDQQMVSNESGSVSRDLVRLFNQLTETKELCSGLFVHNQSNGGTVTAYPARLSFDASGRWQQSSAPANALRLSAYPSESLKFSLSVTAFSSVKKVRANGAIIRPGLIHLYPGQSSQLADSEFIKVEQPKKTNSGTNLKNVQELAFPVLFETKTISGSSEEEIVSCFRSQKKIEYRTFQQTFAVVTTQSVVLSNDQQDDLVFRTVNSQTNAFEMACREDLGWILASCDADAANQYPTTVDYRYDSVKKTRSCRVDASTLTKLRLVCAKAV
jgi:hypothetical protein